MSESKHDRREAVMGAGDDDLVDFRECPGSGFWRAPARFLFGYHKLSLRSQRRQPLRRTP